MKVIYLNELYGLFGTLIFTQVNFSPNFMSHPQQRLFVESVKHHFLPNLSSVLEIGSYDLNGVVRNILECPTIDQYIGVDLVEGPGVDIVCNASEYNSPHLFELVLSCECFEHNPYWLKP